MNEKAKIKLEELAGLLKKQHFFHLSLSSNELFHSNLLYYIAMYFDDTDGQHTLDGTKLESHRKHVEKFLRALKLHQASDQLEKTCTTCTQGHDFQYQVRREDNHRDIAVYRTAPPNIDDCRSEKLIGVAELKVKSLPRKSQLDIYSEKIDKEAKDAKRTLVSLVSMERLPGKWNYCSLEELAVGLWKLSVDISESDTLRRVVDDYTKHLLLMHQLGAVLNEFLTPNLTFADYEEITTSLESSRLAQLWQKIMYQHIAELIVRSVTKSGCSESEIEDDEEDNVLIRCGSETLRVYYGLSNATGMCGVGWELFEPQARGKEQASIGVQIQGEDFRCFVDARGKSVKRKTVEQSLLLGILCGKGQCRMDPKKYAGSDLVSIDARSGSDRGTIDAIDLLSNVPGGSPFELGILESTWSGTGPRAEKSGAEAENAYQYRFHGFEPGFCDIRFKIGKQATLQQVAELAAAYVLEIVKSKHFPSLKENAKKFVST